MGQTWSQQEDEYLLQLFDSAAGEASSDPLKLDKIISHDTWEMIAEAMECQFYVVNVGREPPRSYDAENISRHWKHDLKPQLLQLAEEHLAELAANDTMKTTDVNRLPKTPFNGKRLADLVIQRKPPPPPGFSSYFSSSDAESSEMIAEFNLEACKGNMPPPPRTQYESPDISAYHAGGKQVADLLQNLITTAPDIGMDLLSNFDWLQSYEPMTGIEEEEGEDVDVDVEDEDDSEKEGSDTEMEDAPVGRWVDRSSGRIQKRKIERKLAPKK